MLIQFRLFVQNQQYSGNSEPIFIFTICLFIHHNQNNNRIHLYVTYWHVLTNKNDLIFKSKTNIKTNLRHWKSLELSCSCWHALKKSATIILTIQTLFFFYSCIRLSLDPNIMTKLLLLLYTTIYAQWFRKWRKISLSTYGFSLFIIVIFMWTWNTSHIQNDDAKNSI